MDDSTIAHSEYHKHPITSVEWSPHEASNAPEDLPPQLLFLHQVFPLINTYIPYHYSFTITCRSMVTINLRLTLPSLAIPRFVRDMDDVTEKAQGVVPEVFGVVGHLTTSR